MKLLALCLAVAPMSNWWEAPIWRPAQSLKVGARCNVIETIRGEDSLIKKMLAFEDSVVTVIVREPDNKSSQKIPGSRRWFRPGEACRFSKLFDLDASLLVGKTLTAIWLTPTCQPGKFNYSFSIETPKVYRPPPSWDGCDEIRGHLFYLGDGRWRADGSAYTKIADACNITAIQSQWARCLSSVWTLDGAVSCSERELPHRGKASVEVNRPSYRIEKRREKEEIEMKITDLSTFGVPEPELRALFERRREEIENCYLRQPKNTLPAADVLLRWSIAPRGFVTSLRIGAAGKEEKRFTDCLSIRLKRWRFLHSGRVSLRLRVSSQPKTNLP